MADHRKKKNALFEEKRINRPESRKKSLGQEIIIIYVKSFNIECTLKGNGVKIKRSKNNKNNFGLEAAQRLSCQMRLWATFS